MAETITAVYKNGVFTPLHEMALQEGEEVRLQILPPRVQITAGEARRKVVRFLLDEVSYLLRPEQPTLVKTDRLIWRVPIALTYPSHGIVGQVGHIDVDAENGQLLLSPEAITEIKRNVHKLAENLPSATAA
jgi:predicted DNA-binding antitoxin AbrB/MazE fold protein